MERLPGSSALDPRSAAEFTREGFYTSCPNCNRLSGLIQRRIIGGKEGKRKRRKVNVQVNLACILRRY